MKMKKLLFAILFTLLANTLIAQVTKFKSTSYAFKTKNEYTKKWSKWSAFEETEVLITIDLTNERIRIFSKKEQVYDIIKYYDKETDSDGDETLQFLCVNEDGLKCFVRFVVLNSQNGKRQLYVDFADMMWVYNIYKLD
jgi:hypothetical protein